MTDEPEKPKQHFCLQCGSKDVYFEINNGVGIGEKISATTTGHLDLSAALCRNCGEKGQIGVSELSLAVSAEF